MKTNTKIIVSLFLLCMLLTPSHSAGSKGVEPLVIILDITNDINLSGSNANQRSGSIFGGTRLYIKASGHSLITSENVVTIGSYNCATVANQDTTVSPMWIQCITSPAIYADRRWGQEVLVHTAGRPTS